MSGVVWLGRLWTYQHEAGSQPVWSPRCQPVWSGLTGKLYNILGSDSTYTSPWPGHFPPRNSQFTFQSLAGRAKHESSRAASHRSFTVSSSLDSISHPQTEVGSEIRGLNCLTLPSELQNFRWGVMMRLRRWSGSAKLSRPGLVTQNCLLIGQIKLFWASHWPSRSRLRHTWGANHKLIPEYAYNWEAMTYIL